MTQDNRDREPNTEATDPGAISYTPGPLEDKETASARANRTQQRDTTSQIPEGAELRKGGAEQPGEHGDTRQAEQSESSSTERQPPLGTSADPMR